MDEECEVWNGAMMKLGWRDSVGARLHQRITAAGLEGRRIETMFDLFDVDEGRDPVARRAWEGRPSLVIVLMGVAGSGKTTVGGKLSEALGWEFRDADTFHPPANIAKMAAGHPLTDEDRAPWLASIRRFIDHSLARDDGAIVTCSALRESYRQVLVADPARVKLVHLAGDFRLIEGRMAHRSGHFMKPKMLESQFATLEPPRAALTIDVAQTPDAIVAEIRSAFQI